MDKEQLRALLTEYVPDADSKTTEHLAQVWQANPFNGFLYLENHPAFARYKKALLALEAAGIVRTHLDSTGVMWARLDVKTVRNLKWKDRQR